MHDRPDPQEPAVEIRGLLVRYGSVVALDGVDIRCNWGDVVGLIGPNGAGKSTLVNVLANLAEPEAGAVKVLGRRYTSPQDESWIKTRVGFLLSSDALFEYLSGREFLVYTADAYDLPRDVAEARILDLTEMLELGPYLDRLTVEYSRGNQKKLAIAAALVHDPALLVLDEPFESLDPLAVVRLRRFLRERADAGRAVLVTSHILSALEPVIDRVIVLYRGAVAAAGSVSQVTEGLTGVATLEELYEALIAPNNQT
jgi:ABC-2 type transport system ATP-binding protein